MELMVKVLYAIDVFEIFLECHGTLKSQEFLGNKNMKNRRI
jgi:hypothetical protein